MTGKRYFKRMWEEEYYIFDSQTISEKEFDEKVEYEDYQAFEDSMQGDEVVNRLNNLSERGNRLTRDNNLLYITLQQICKRYGLNFNAEVSKNDPRIKEEQS